MVLAGVDKRVLEVLEVVLDVEVVQLCACTMRGLTLPFPSQQGVELDIPEAFELGGIDHLDVGEGEGDFALLAHALLLLLHRDYFAVLEVALQVLLAVAFEGGLLALSCLARLLVVELYEVVAALAHDFVLEGVLVVAGNDLLVDGLREVGLGLLLPPQLILLPAVGRL